MATNIVDFLIRLRGNATNAITAARQVDRQLAQVERTATRVGGALRNAFSMANFSTAIMAVPGMQFLTNPYVMAGAAVGAVTSVGMAAEKTAVNFKVLLGSQEASKKMLDDIAGMDMKKVYGLETSQEAAKQMLNFGVESDKVLGYLSQLGDIAGGDKQKLSSLGLVFGQVTAAGKLSGQDLLQFINAGFNPLKELEALTGESYAKLQDRMSKGQITAEHVAIAMQRATSEGGRFFGLTEEQSQTTAAKLQDMYSQIQEGVLKVWEVIQPHVSDAISLISQIIPPAMEVVSVVAGAIGNVITWILKWKKELGIFAVFFGTFWAMIKVRLLLLFGFAKAVTFVKNAIHMWTVVQRYLNIALVSNPIGIVIALVAALAAAVIYCWNEFEGFRAFCLTAWDVLKGLGEAIYTYVTSRVTELMEAVGAVGQALKHLFAGEFEKAWESAKTAGLKFSGVESSTQLVKGVSNAFSGLGDKYNAHLAAELAKEKPEGGNPISNPSLLGSVLPEVKFGDPEGNGNGGGGGGKGGKAGKSKTASAIATGGQRNTAIRLSIGKFFDTINVYMADKADTAELERVILQALNRSLAIATSSER